jgi:hypothetical protein
LWYELKRTYSYTVKMGTKVATIFDNAKAEAASFKRHRIAPEHVLLALFADKGDKTAQCLKSCGLHLGDVRRELEDIVGFGRADFPGDRHFTVKLTRVIERAARYASANSCEIKSEHLLLSLVEENKGPTQQVLARLGVDRAALRNRLLRSDVREQVPNTSLEPIRIPFSGLDTLTKPSRNWDSADRQFRRGDVVLVSLSSSHYEYAILVSNDRLIASNRMLIVPMRPAAPESVEFSFMITSGSPAAKSMGLTHDVLVDCGAITSLAIDSMRCRIGSAPEEILSLISKELVRLVNDKP